MSRNRITAIVAVTGIAVVLLGSFLAWAQIKDDASPEPALDNKEGVGLGITYLPVTPQVSAYYGLARDSGALVTEVVPNSPAARAGIKEGDIIFSFNGARLEREIPLLGMMMACPEGNSVRLEIWREGGMRTVELFHPEG